MIINLIFALIQWALLIAMRLPLIIIGFFVVGIGIFFRREMPSKSDGRPIQNLPRVIWLWGNDHDGLLGDKRFWWDEEADNQVLFGLLPQLRKVLSKVGVSVPRVNSHNWISMFWWAAVRNPVNNMRHVKYISCPLPECNITYWGDDEVKDRSSKTILGSHFYYAQRPGKWYRWYGLYSIVRIFSTKYAFVTRIGYKFSMDEGMKPNPSNFGMTFKINVIRIAGE